MDENPLGPDKLWIFLIDTDSYAGNFAYDMCAYMTGRVGECGAGEEMAARYCEDMGIVDLEDEHNDHIVDMPESREYMPAAPWLTPGAGVYNSVAIFMSRPPTESEVESMIVRARKYADAVILGKILGFRLVLRETTESQVASFPIS